MSRQAMPKRHLQVAICMLLLTGAWSVAVVGDERPITEVTTGRVASVQLLDVSALGQDSILLLHLAGGRSFQLPGEQRLSAGTGVEVEVRYLPADQASELPVACRIRVLAIPVEREGGEVLQSAERAFEVYRNREMESEC